MHLRFVLLLMFIGQSSNAGICSVAKRMSQKVFGISLRKNDALTVLKNSDLGLKERKDSMQMILEDSKSAVLAPGAFISKQGLKMPEHVHSDVYAFSNFVKDKFRSENGLAEGAKIPQIKFKSWLNKNIEDIVGDRTEQLMQITRNRVEGKYDFDTYYQALYQIRLQNDPSRKSIDGKVLYLPTDKPNIVRVVVKDFDNKPEEALRKHFGDSVEFNDIKTRVSYERGGGNVRALQFEALVDVRTINKAKKSHKGSKELPRNIGDIKVDPSSKEAVSLLTAVKSEKFYEGNPFYKVEVAKPFVDALDRGVKSYSRRVFRSSTTQNAYGTSHDFVSYKIVHPDGKTSMIQVFKMATSNFQNPLGIGLSDMRPVQFQAAISDADGGHYFYKGGEGKSDDPIKGEGVVEQLEEFIDVSLKQNGISELSSDN